MRRFSTANIKIATTVAFVAVCVFCSGCGTTKWSDTSRTATEQLLISNAIDSAVTQIDFTPIGDKRVFLDTEAIGDVTDNKYLAKALRQHLAASGGVLCDDREDADYVVEARAGAVGTDRDELLLVGVPAMSIPGLPGTDILAATIPEIPVVKQTKQRGVAKIAVFAYNRHTGRPIWASGNNQTESNANNLWIAGAGPLSVGTIYKTPLFAGHAMSSIEAKLRNPRTFADRPAVFREIPGESTLKVAQTATPAVTTQEMPSEPTTPVPNPAQPTLSPQQPVTHDPFLQQALTPTPLQ